MIIDETTLINSRRVPKEIGSFIQNKLQINIESISNIQGNYELIEDINKINEILKNQAIVKLFYNNSKNYNCLPNINWGYSKGSTYKNICIILTKQRFT